MRFGNCSQNSRHSWTTTAEPETLFLGARSHRTRKHICTQICMQTLWCCLQVVWTLRLNTMCSIIYMRLLQGVPRLVWTGPKLQKNNFVSERMEPFCHIYVVRKWSNGNQWMAKLLVLQLLLRHTKPQGSCCRTLLPTLTDILVKM